MYIGGQWAKARNGKSFETTDPLRAGGGNLSGCGGVPDRKRFRIISATNPSSAALV